MKKKPHSRHFAGFTPYLKSVITVFICLLLTSSYVFSLPDIPKGYKNDFDGCRKTEDPGKREKCCRIVESVCLENCDAHDIDCKEYCVIEEFFCSEGPQNNGKGITGPGRGILDASTLKGVLESGNTLKPEDGYNFKTKFNSIIIEVQQDDKTAPQHTLLIKCICPDISYNEKSYLCRPFVTDKVAECRICRWQTCEKCTNCKTELYLLD